MRTRNNKGITIIALVITIIVLLILAGVTISMVLGDDGIIAQAEQAKADTKIAQIKEEQALTEMEVVTEVTTQNIPLKYTTIETEENSAGYITGINVDNPNAETVLEFKERMKNLYTVWTKDSEGNEIEATNNANMATGMVVKKNTQTGEKIIGTVIVYGDVDGNGTIGLNDSTQTFDLTNESEYYKRVAADVDDNRGIVNNDDAQYILNHFTFGNEVAPIDQYREPAKEITVDITVEDDEE